MAGASASRASRAALARGVGRAEGLVKDLTEPSYADMAGIRLNRQCSGAGGHRSFCRVDELFLVQAAI
jgi:hypothetical protein